MLVCVRFRKVNGSSIVYSMVSMCDGGSCVRLWLVLISSVISISIFSVSYYGLVCMGFR